MKRLVAFVVLVALFFAAPSTNACVGVGALMRDGGAETFPYLSTEQVLILWDPETQTEDLIREVRFERANQTFGFIVPVPTKPEISEVKVSPFDALAKAYEFVDPNAIGRAPINGARGIGVPPAVNVLAKQRIGSFTAFTIATTDPKALETWLTENGFGVTFEIKRWLDPYVKMKFTFAAFRYDAKPDVTAGMTSETVRIRFKTPNPYFPYNEPDVSVGAPPVEKRLLAGWIVTVEPTLAIAAEPTRVRWTRPWAYGKPIKAATNGVASVIGAELGALLPKADKLVVQPFRDTRVYRNGIGDVLLVPSTPVTFTDADIAARKELLPIIEPRLLDETPVPSLPASAAPQRASPPERGGCTTAPGSDRTPGWAALVVVAAALGWRRRCAALGLLALAACGRSDPAPPAVADASASASAPGHAEPQRADLERKALALLAGEVTGYPIADPAVTPPEPGTGLVTIKSVKSADGTAVPKNADRVLASATVKMRACYNTRLQKEPAESGLMTIFVVLAPNGEVRSAEVASTSGVSFELGGCVARVIRTLAFDADAQPARLHVALTLSLQR